MFESDFESGFDSNSIPDINDFQEIESNPLLEFTDELTESKVLETLNGYNSDWDTSSTEHYRKLKSHYSMYRNFEGVVDATATKIPEIFQTIETELPHLLNSIFAHSEIVSLEPRFNDIDRTKTYKVQTYINRLIKDVCEGERKTKLIIKDMLIYGWAVAKVKWENVIEKDYDPITKQPIETQSSHPDFYQLDNFSFAYDTNYTEQTFNNLPWCRERTFISKSKLKTMRDSGMCADFLDSEMESEADNKGKSERGMQNRTKSTDTFYDEFWVTMYDKDENGNLIANEYIAWVLCNKTIIKFQKNPLNEKPFVLVRCYDIAQNFLGFGEAEVLGPLSTQLSYTHYQGGKLLKKLGNATTYVGPSANISPDNLRLENNGIIFMDNINDIKTQPPVEATNVKAIVDYHGYLEGQIESITGVTKYLQGEDMGDMTATQASLVAQSATNRLAGKLENLKNSFVVPLARLFFKFNKQLLELPVEYFDNNNQLINLTQEDFVGNYDFVSTGTVSQSNKALQMQQNSALISQFIQAAGASQGTPNPFYPNIQLMITKLIGPYTNTPDISEFFIQGQVPPVQPTGTETGNETGVANTPNPSPNGQPLQPDNFEQPEISQVRSDAQYQIPPA